VTFSVKPLGILVSMLVLAAACSIGDTGGGARPDPSGKPVRGGTVTFALDMDVVDLDPLRSRNVSDRAVHYQIYDSLVAIDTAGKIIPWLARDWTLSQADSVLTFKLRENVTYHDGSAFDAESVKWNIDRYRAPGSARSGELAPIVAVEVLDASTIRFKLRSPSPTLLPSLVDRAGMMVSRKAVDSAGENFTRNAFKAGTGPFVLTEAVKDDHVTIVRNPNWWGRASDGGALPYLDQVIFKPILDGDVRVTNVRTGAALVATRINGKDIPQVRADQALIYREAPASPFGSLIPNRAPGFIFNEGRYVKAVAMAIDRKEVLANAFGGFGLVGYGPIAPAHFAFDPSFKPYEMADVAAAKKLVQEVGRGPLRFELLYPTGDAAMQQTALLIQSQLLKAEITADIKAIGLAEILKLQSDRKFPGLTLFGWSGRIDPDGNVYDHLHTGGVLNDSSYSNAQVDRLLEEQRATNDPPKRRAALRAAEQIYVVDDPARIWYRFGHAQVLTAKAVQGLEPYPDSLVRLHYAWLRR
jgi:peptide/nickel transport system substrate-binding protein